LVLIILCAIAGKRFRKVKNHLIFIRRNAELKIHDQQRNRPPDLQAAAADRETEVTKKKTTKIESKPQKFEAELRSWLMMQGSENEDGELQVLPENWLDLFRRNAVTAQ
jgi:hypothetical protein